MQVYEFSCHFQDDKLKRPETDFSGHLLKLRDGSIMGLGYIEGTTPWYIYGLFEESGLAFFKLSDDEQCIPQVYHFPEVSKKGYSSRISEWKEIFFQDPVKITLNEITLEPDRTDMGIAVFYHCHVHLEATIQNDLLRYTPRLGELLSWQPRF